MTNISKTKLSQKLEKQLFTQLCELFTSGSPALTHTVLNELLGYEEKIMLAKRFAIITLLWQGHSLYSIAKKLHVSSSTVTRIQMDYSSGRYNNIVSLFQKPSPSFIDILNTIDNILHLGGIMPHYGQTHRSEQYKNDTP